MSGCRGMFFLLLYIEKLNPPILFFFFEFIFSYACVGKTSLNIPTSLVEERIGGNFGHRMT